MAGSERKRRLVEESQELGLTRRQFIDRGLKLGLSVSGTAALLAACTGSKHTSAPKKLTGRAQILVGFGDGNSAAQRQVQQVLAQAFIHDHPQVGIDFIRAADVPAAETQLSALIARGSAPHIVLGIGLAEVARFVDQHYWLDLHSYFDRDKVTLGSFLSESRAPTSVRSYYQSGKTIVGVPVGVHDHALAYNEELFSKAGVPVPPVSWSDGSWAFDGKFLAAAQALTRDAKGKPADAAGFDPAHISQFGVGHLRPEVAFYAFGGHAYNRSSHQAQFSAPSSVAGIQFASDLVNRYHVQPSPAQVADLGAAGDKGNEEQTAWRAGKLAMIDMCSCEIDSPFGTKVPFSWKAAALPKGPDRRFGFEELSLGTVVAASGNHDLAWEVLKFFAIDPANEVKLGYEGLGAIPTLSANLNAFGQGIKQSLSVDATPWIAGLASASTEHDDWIPSFVDVHNLMTGAFEQVMGGAPASQVMPQLQLQAQGKIDAWFKANKLPR